MRSAEGGRRGLFEVPFERSSERNEFHSRADGRLSAVEPKHLSSTEAVTLFQESEKTLKDNGKIGLELIRFRLRTPVLVADPVFVEHLVHLLGDHIAIVLNGNERNFFSDLGHRLWSGNFRGCGGSFWCLTHRGSIHYQDSEKGGYSNASRDDCSG